MLEAEVALLDEVEQFHAGGQGIAAGDAHDQPEVGADEPVLGLGCLANGAVQDDAGFAGFLLGACLGACFDGLGQLPLILGVEQGDHPDLVQVLAYGITHYLFTLTCSIRGPIRAQATGGFLEVGSRAAGWGGSTAPTKGHISTDRPSGKERIG